MIDLNLKPASLAAPADSSFRYYEPAQPANGADRWHLGTATYRLLHVAVPLDGSEPVAALMRQTAKGQDYARGGRRVHTLRLLATVLDGDVNRIAAHVQQVRDAVVRVLLDEQRGAAEQGPATAEEALAAYTGPARMTLTAEGVRKLAEHTGETLGQVEQAARRQGMTVEPQPEQGSSWGGPAATIPVDEDAPMLDDEAQLAEFDPAAPADCKVCGQEIEPSPLVPAGEDPLWQHVDPSAQRQRHKTVTNEQVQNIARAFGADPAAVRQVARTAGMHVEEPVDAPRTSRLVRLSTRHPEPDECKGDEYGTWVALGGTLADYFTEEPGGGLTAADIRVLAAWHNVSPFAVLDLLDKRGIAHEPDPQLVPEGSEVES